MTRSEFLKKSLTMGIGLPFCSMFLKSCEVDAITVPELDINFSGKIIIVGAGAAGLAAGYLLQRHNIDFQIIEASSVFGGRVKQANNFADFPIDIGAEWIHASPSVLATILDNPDINGSMDFVTYNPQSLYIWNGEKLKKHNYASGFYNEYKFKQSTWYEFFEQHIVPDFVDKIVFDQPITEIDYSQDKVQLKTLHDEVYEADKVLITIPIKVLQNDVVSFTPNLPTAKTEAINSIHVGDGLKVFIEFKERFYPDALFFGQFPSAFAEDDKIYYDAAFRKDSSKNILGLFTINEKASEYTKLASDQAIIDKILSELDEIFDGKASENYVQHIVQNWSNEPYIQGAYSYEFDNDVAETMDTISEPVNNKLYFAGEALSLDNQATVHGACESGYAAIAMMLAG